MISLPTRVLSRMSPVPVPAQGGKGFNKRIATPTEKGMPNIEVGSDCRPSDEKLEVQLFVCSTLSTESREFPFEIFFLFNDLIKGLVESKPFQKGITNISVPNYPEVLPQKTQSRNQRYDVPNFMA